MEQAVAEGHVINQSSFVEWTGFILQRGALWNDAILFSLAFGACGRKSDLAEINDLAFAFCGSKERAEESLLLGTAFAQALKNSDFDVDAIAEMEPTYAIVAGAASGVLCGGEDSPLSDRELAITLFLQSSVHNLIAVAQRLVPIGQRDGVAAATVLLPKCAEVAAKAAVASANDLGGAGFGADIAAMRHERLQPRIFKT